MLFFPVPFFVLMLACMFIFLTIVFYIACPYGYYGLDCKHACNSTCMGCEAVSGLCNTGCIPGWRGDYCQRSKLYIYIYIYIKWCQMPVACSSISFFLIFDYILLVKDIQQIYIFNNIDQVWDFLFYYRQRKKKTLLNNIL